MDNDANAVPSTADIVNSSVANIRTEVDTLLNSTCKQSCKPPDADILKSFQMRLEQDRDKSIPNRRRGWDYRDALGNMDDAEIMALLSDGVNLLDEHGNTMLSVVIETNRVELCRTLLEHGANPDISCHGYDAMEGCIISDSDKSVQMLDMMLGYTQYGLCDQHGMGMTLLHLAVSCRRLDVIRYLLQKGAEMSDMDIDCVTVSEYARQKGGADYVTQIRLMQTEELECTKTSKAPNEIHHERTARGRTPDPVSIGKPC